MNTIGKNIAELRKNKGMTQEVFGSVLGVSPQTVSKWENNTNMPDITLLPVIADIFEVSVDELLGRKTQRNTYVATERIEYCGNSLLESMFTCMYDESSSEPFGESLEKYKKALRDNDSLRTAIICKDGVAYYREKLGGLLLKKTKGGWSGLLDNSENYDLLELMTDRDFRAVLSETVRTGKTFFTVASIAKRCGITDTQALEKNLYKSKLFDKKTVDIEDGQVTVYDLAQGNRLFLVFAVLAFALEYERYEEAYRGYICDGDYYFD